MGASSVTVCQTQISWCQIQMCRFRHFIYLYFTIFVLHFYPVMQIHNICNGVLSELKTTKSDDYMHLSGL